MRPDPLLPLTLSFPVGVLDMFCHQVTQTPQSVAVSDDFGHWTYRELDEASSRVAADIVDAGIEPRRTVTVLGYRDRFLVVAMLAALKARTPFCILDSAYPETRMKDQIEAIHPAGLLSLPAHAPPIAILDAHVHAGCNVVVNVGSPSARSGPAPRQSCDPYDPAYLLFTSGTTGKPKGIVTPHHALPHFLRWYAQQFAPGPTDHFAMLAGLAHDPLLRDVFVPLTSGASLLIPPQDLMRQPDRLVTWLRMHRITVAHLTPSLCRLLCNGASNGMTLPDLRLAIFSGEVLRYRDVVALRRLAPRGRVVNGYGASETPQLMAYHALAEGEERCMDPTGIVPIGTGIADVQILVMTEGCNLAGEDETGEICIRTPYLSQGYLSDPDRIHAPFQKNPFPLANALGPHTIAREAPDLLYRTGDLGRYDHEGKVHFTGRVDNQVKIRGFRVEIEEVEAFLHQDTVIAQGAIVCELDRSDALRLVACVVLREGCSLEGLRERLQAVLPDYMAPTEYVAIESLPLTPNGKVDRKALLAALPGLRPTHTAHGVAANDTERRLIDLWENVLDTRPIGTQESFFELGGHSLLAAVLLTRIHAEFGVSLPMSALLRANTVEALACTLTAGTDLAEGITPVLLCEGSGLPAFWLPGGGGLSVLAFRQIASLIDADRPIYGMESSIALALTDSDLPTKATAYIDAIRREQPQGPYHLFGFSAGSWLAYEIAIQLTAAGESMGALVVFDTEVPGFLSPLAWLRMVGQAVRYHVWALRKLPPPRWVDYLKRTAKEIYWSELRKRNALKWDARRRDGEAGGDEVGDVFTHADNQSRRATYAYTQHVPTYASVIHMVVAEKSPKYAGVSSELDRRQAWRHLTCGGTVVHTAPGDHLSMLEHPQVETTAAILRKILTDSTNPCRRAKGE